MNIIGVIAVGCGGILIGAFESEGGKQMQAYGAVVATYGLNLYIYYARYRKALREQAAVK